MTQEIGKNQIEKQPIIEKDSVKTLSEKENFQLKKDSIPTIASDSIPTDSIQKPKEVIQHIITHDAEDYTIQNAKNKTVTLYNKAKIVYGDINVEAGKIIIDYEKNTVYATGIKDSTGYVQRPVFKQGNQETEQDSILYNIKTKKALIYGVKTVQGEMITYGEKTKRVNDSTIYMRKLRFTTSQKDIPDYYIATNKAKLVPGKKIIVGGSNLVIADVPTPLYLPFAYFPLSKSRTSGFIIPTWGENSDQGFFLQNGGYYFAINDYVDLEVTTDLYSNGSWALNTSSSYVKRYKYSGGFSFRYQNLKNNILGFSDYSETSNFNVSWNHRQDTKSNPNSSLSARVNISSSGSFYRQSLNEIDQSQQFTNSFSSSINYSKTFPGTPFNMSTTITHSQNSNTEDITMTLPSLQVNMNRIYPFTGKGGVKKNALQKVGVTYSMQGKYNIDTNEENFLTAKMFDGARAGIQHNVSASTNIKAFKYFTLSPSFNFQDVWYFDKIRKSYDNSVDDDGNIGNVVTDTISGFNRFHEYSFSTSLSTNIYGRFIFKKGRLKAIRHTLRPSISWTYRPDFANAYEERVRNSSTASDIDTYTQFDAGIYGAPSSSISNSISFSLNNVLEAKVAPKEDEDSEEDKKVTLINNLNLSSSYNFAADSLNLSNISASMGIPFFQNKMMMNFSGSFDPYQVDSEGTTIDKFNAFPRLETLTVSTGYSFSSEDFQKDKDGKKNSRNNNDSNGAIPDVLNSDVNPNRGFSNRAGGGNNNSEKKKDEVTELYRSKIPWNISFNYGVSYQNNGYSTNGITNNSVSFNGNVELTPKWKVSFNSGYDFDEGAFTHARFNFSRDLDSWRFNFNWTPFGTYTSYYFFIGIKSSMLSDLKWDKNQPPDRSLF